MKITASKRTVSAGRRDDIMRERDEWESRFNEQHEQYEREYEQWDSAMDAVFDSVRQEVEQGLSRFNKLVANVSVGSSFSFKKARGISVRIEVNESNKHSEDVALSWNMRIELSEDGEVEKETNSWSGLKATTAEQLESLRQTLAALEYLNSIDWKPLLDRPLPKYSDYVKTRDPNRRDRPDFEGQLTELDLADLVGSDKAVKCNNWETSGYRGRYVWVQLVRETPAGYTVRVRGDWNKDEVRTWLRRAIDQNFATQRMRKSSLKPVKPLETLDPATDEEMEEARKAYLGQN